MSLKDSFTSEEWARVLGAPMIAGIAVTAAEPGGLWGAVKESVAVASTIGKAKSQGEQNALIDEVVAAYGTSEGRDQARGVLKHEAAGRKPPEVVEAAIAELDAVARVVAAKAPNEAAGFKAWLGEIADKVAEAGTEGGFLGFGGEKVSAAEKATLDKIASVLA
jgi:hypothetical protein